MVCARKRAQVGLLAGVVATAGCAFPAVAQTPARPQTPRNWTYEVGPQGNRVVKGNRVTKPDGSWREETREGNCITVKERSASGEYRETRQCNAGKSG